MTGILAEFASLVPAWDQLAWSWATRVREENAVRERSRMAPRVRRSAAVPGRLSVPQKREATRLRSQGKSLTEIAVALKATRWDVRRYFSEKRSAA